MDYAARWITLSLCVVLAIINLGLAVYDGRDIPWAIGCTILVIALAVVVAYRDFLEFDQARKDANARSALNRRQKD